MIVTNAKPKYLVKRNLLTIIQEADTGELFPGIL